MDKYENNLIKRTDSWIAARSGEETLMMQVQTGQYMSLNDTATAVWEALEKPAMFQDVVAAVVSEFEVSEEQAERDVETLLDGLIKNDVLSVEKS
ncbi:hypothetical protein UF64_06945 [Thalassospira sp. HJ]|uniref:PqqD family protein n=1 Tax=Thalassospira sp. HJ TaxID=1616823 RepID=UPI0005CE6BE7|nr:PqqD family protein [Thalassospira sp. HJ]KJE35843.1 hypothetical protein UF64_06945 [Thalassospira sp. HJ]